MVLPLLAVLLGIVGVFLYRRKKKVAGGLLVVIGATVAILGIVIAIIAILNFHP
jgi:hypothetical protein